MKVNNIRFDILNEILNKLIKVKNLLFYNNGLNNPHHDNSNLIL